MWLHGFGFPRYRGGLMYWADGIGVKNVYAQIASWHQQYGERWAPSKLLRELAETNTPFREAKPAPFALIRPKRPALDNCIGDSTNVATVKA